MADIQDLRARAREAAYEPERSSGLPFWLIAASRVIGIDEVLVLMMASGLSTPCRSLRTLRLVSSFSVAASTDRPEKFIGIHFMNPVPVMELVELIRGIATNDTTFDTCREFVKKLHKTIAVAEDFPAFIVNHLKRLKPTCISPG